MPLPARLVGLAVLLGIALPASGRDIQRPSVARTFAVTDLGAVGDGVTLNTRAIQAAVDACAQAGGGTVVIPPGRFLSGAIFLKPDVHLRLDKGAVLRGSQDIRDYPVQDTRIEGQTTPWAVALVNATGTHGLRITGEGTIDGNGAKFWQKFWATRQENPQCTNLEVVRPRLMHIRDARDVVISGIRLRDSGFWTLHLFQCEGVKLENLRITAPEKPVRAPSSDGIDIDSCRDVMVRGCYIAVGDDCIALKSGKGPTAHLENRPVENVLIEQCEFGHGHGVVTLGSEATVVRHVTVRDCQVTGVNRLVRFKLRPDTRQVFEHITYENIRMKGGEVFDVRPWKQFVDAKLVTSHPSIVRDVRLRNISAMDVSDVGELCGNPSDTLEDFHFENVTITSKQPHWPAHTVKQISLHQVTLNGEAIPTPVLKEKAAKKTRLSPSFGK